MILEGKDEATEFLERAGARFLAVTEHIAKFAGSRPLHPDDGMPLLLLFCISCGSACRCSQASASAVKQAPRDSQRRRAGLAWQHASRAVMEPMLKLASSVFGGLVGTNAAKELIAKADWLGTF